MAAAALCAGAARAQDLEPREYANSPIGLNFLILGYSYSTGEVSADASVPLQDAEINANSGFLAYARSVELWGKSGKFDVVLPYTGLDGTARFAGMPVDRTVSGLGDPRMRVSVNLLGAPPLTFEEFADWEQDTILGASLRVTAPLGQYDDDKLVNVGTHRWTIKPEVGVSKRWRRFTVELAGAVALYGDNRDFMGDSKREQDPLWSIQAHLIHSFPFGIWGAIDATYYTGGQTTVDGDEADDRQRNTRLGATLSFPLNRYHSIKMYASTGVSERIGGDFDIYGIAWQLRWGGGL